MAAGCLWLILCCPMQATLERVGSRGNTGDLDEQPFYRFIQKTYVWHIVAMFVALYAFGGLPAVVWGGALRAVWVYHITWFVNSASHCWGYQVNFPPLNTFYLLPFLSSRLLRTLHLALRRAGVECLAMCTTASVVSLTDCWPVPADLQDRRPEPQQLVGGCAGVWRGLAQQPPRL